MGRTPQPRSRRPALDAATLRKSRLEQLLKLALAYRDWSRKELAKTLGRDPTKLVPGTGIPKLDLVVELADVLDWPVGEVVGFLWGPQVNGVDTAGADFESLESAAKQASAASRDQLAVDLAVAAYDAAPGPDERARASILEALGWGGQGRSHEVVQAATRGLQEHGLEPAVRRRLQVILADAYYTSWSLVESRSISRDLLDEFRQHRPRTAEDELSRGAAHFLSGQTHRRLMSVEPHRTEALAAAARRDLEPALLHYRRIAVDADGDGPQGRANTCFGALIESDVAAGRRTAADALNLLSAGLDRVRDTASITGDCLESYGWWCIFGCNIALRHLTDDRLMQQHMAVFTNKADEIANELDNWALRERVLTMQYTRWERAAGSTSFEIPCVIDSDDVRIITGTMGRFPAFRRMGWRILETAQIVDWH